MTQQVYGLKGQKVWSKQYPWSLGLFFSAITKRIGLKPNEDEYITMGMAAFGDPCVDMSTVHGRIFTYRYPTQEMVLE